MSEADYELDQMQIADDLADTTNDLALALSRLLADEVGRLRDRIALRSGLTRQEIARAIGVDRRSLSGFVTGEIRPTEERLRALRVLADTADWSAAEFGERAREVLRGPDPDSSPLLLIATGVTDLRRELHEAAERSGVVARTRIATRTRDKSKEPLHIAASERWAQKRNLPTRTGEARAQATYEQADDLADTTNDLALALSRIHELEQGIREAAEWCHSDLPHTAGFVLTALLDPS